MEGSSIAAAGEIYDTREEPSGESRVADLQSQDAESDGAAGYRHTHPRHVERVATEPATSDRSERADGAVVDAQAARQSWVFT